MCTELGFSPVSAMIWEVKKGQVHFCCAGENVVFQTLLFALHMVLDYPRDEIDPRMLSILL